MSDIFEITKAATFDAAHHLNNGPTDNPYRRMHGHSFRVEATVRGPASEPDGWVADLGALDHALRAAALELDHSLLNEHEGLENPTLEHLCQFFARKLRPDFPGLSRITVARPTIGESCSLGL
ncbi:6-pyruvoyl trahydropterin synthase family protein [Phenylobacterium montanum]|uniref:6-carboxy-5,6,7,8-tetrahydropterin synthase n=1 Tax=Phenylobacterium montanum TaxID=2823693 RepID=A0A975FX66_9CAUL|nr:6-carboxytetrahydropterin synthase [Caulobacter sp. S6]QUD87118.1 6-carboxytetrahydropterin synthase [Caulobacter sp. S6]